MVDPQIPSDRVEKRKEEIRDSGFATKQDEIAKDKQKEQFAKEKKGKNIPVEEESFWRMIKRKLFKKTIYNEIKK